MQSGSHPFSSSNEMAAMPFTAPFRITAVPDTLQVTADQDGFTLDDLSLTLMRLGDA